VHRYKLERSEGLFLRYLTDAWRTLDRSLPETAYTDMLEDVIVWLASLIRATDASLLDEWTQLSGASPDTAPRVVVDPVWGAPKAWRTAVRTAAFGWVELLARRSYEPLAARSGWASHDLAGAMRPFWTEHEWIAIDAAARANAFFTLEESPTIWNIRQQLVDPAGSGEWSFTATVDVAEAMEAGGPTLKLVTLGRYDDVSR
jgi:Domain of unknown function (DUF3516)